MRPTLEAPAVHLDFQAPPSAFKYMAGAFLPRPKPDPLVIPFLLGVWRNLVPDRVIPRAVLEEFLQVEGSALDPVLLHACTMRLMMALLTHPRFPISIWNILQVRNVLQTHLPVAGSETLEAVAEVSGQRLLEKGAEIDVRVQMLKGGQLALESLTVFYVRGRFGPASPGLSLPSAPEPPTHASRAISIPRRGALAFAKLTGDYNGIHWWRRYARILGFPASFSHPHRALARILECLPGWQAGSPALLNIWYKGPAFYEKDLRISWAQQDEQTVFALRVGEDPRPAILGTLSGMAARLDRQAEARSSMENP